MSLSASHSYIPADGCFVCTRNMIFLYYYYCVYIFSTLPHVQHVENHMKQAATINCRYNEEIMFSTYINVCMLRPACNGVSMCIITFVHVKRARVSWKAIKVSFTLEIISKERENCACTLHSYTQIKGEV